MSGGRNQYETNQMQLDRASHADFSVEKRRKKAEKIVSLLAPYKSLRGSHLLDVGTGSGFIAARLAEHVGAEGSVVSVDRVDERLAHDGYNFALVEDCRLPFDDKTFDLVISNHVIEHTGLEDDQRTHLSELHRVLKCDGVLYLAAPNQWTLIEPHFRLPFLSWLPMAMRSVYVRLCGRGSHYDCYPRSRRVYRRLLKDCGFDPTDVTAEAVRAVSRIEEASLVSRLASCVPAFLIRVFPWLPTIIFVARPQLRPSKLASGNQPSAHSIPRE